MYKISNIVGKHAKIVMTRAETEASGSRLEASACSASTVSNTQTQTVEEEERQAPLSIGAKLQKSRNIYLGELPRALCRGTFSRLQVDFATKNLFQPLS
jgi:hypothetical protein